MIMSLEAKQRKRKKAISNIAAELGISFDEAISIYYVRMRRRASSGGKSVNPKNRPFSKDRKLAKRASKKRHKKGET